MVEPEQLHYPAVVADPTGFAYLVATADRLQQCSARAHKRGYLSSVRVLDLEGRLYRVDRADNPRVIKGGLRRLLRGALFQVELKLEPEATLTPEETRKYLRGLVQKHPESWEAVEDISDVVARLDAASTMMDLFEVFSVQA